MTKHLIIWLAVGIGLTACEIPKKPDFKTSHKAEAPLIYDKTFNFMGDSTALIDTTSADMDSLFTVDGNNFITISKEQKLDFGDMDGAVPVIEVDPTDFESEVGELKLTNFSSDEDGNLGDASFEELTGIDGNTVQVGDPVPAGSPQPVTIDLETDLFESATFKYGALDISLRNDLGFDLNSINITLVSDPDDQSQTGDEYDLQSTSTGTVNNGEEVTTSFSFDGICESNPDPEDCRLFNPSVRVSITWTAGQPFQTDPQSLVVVSATGNELYASQVQAALEEQDFSTNNVSSFNSEDFEFTTPDHFVELKTGNINIHEIVNEMEFDIESMVMTFPDIQRCPADLTSTNPIVTNINPLEISYINSKKIPRAFGANNPGIAPEENVDIAGCFLYAEGNQVDYDIVGITENTQNAQPGNQIRLVQEEDAIHSTVEITDVTIFEAFGIVKQQNEWLNEDEGEDGAIDLYNPNEAELTEIDGLSDLSKQLEGLEFSNPTLSINYFSNIGLPTTIYGSFVGTNSKGEEVYLTGKPVGGEVVQDSDPTEGLLANGSQLSKDRLVKFSLEEIEDREGRAGTPIAFTSEGSNVDDFLNNLPDRIRFIGKSVINEGEGEETVYDELVFDPTVSINIPLAFKAEQANFSDTTEMDFGDLPSAEKGDKSTLTEGILNVEYVNGLPLNVGVTLFFLDENKQEFDAITGSESIELTAAGVGSDQFVNAPFEGSTGIALSESTLSQLYKTKYIRFRFDLNTTNKESIKMRTNDFIKLTVKAQLTVDSEVD